jgi:hypothetical protein
VDRLCISYGGSAIAVEYDGARQARIVDFVYHYAPRGCEPPPHVIYRFVPTAEPQRLALHRNGVAFFESSSDAVLADVLMGDSCRNLVDRSLGGLMFHAAALAWQGRTLILPGTIGAGKSTLTAWLISKDFQYLTDELVFVPCGSEGMRVFTRPLNLKRPSRGPLRGHFDYPSAPAGGENDALVWSTPFNDLISPAMLGTPEASRADLPLHSILFARYSPDTPFEWRPLSKAQAGLMLMECLVNARNLPGHGFSEVARLARVVPACALRYSRFEQLETRIEDLMRSV